MRAVLSVLLFFTAATASAGRFSRYFDYFNTEAFWSRLVLESDMRLPAFAATDTCMLVASNRAPGPDSLRFMSEDRADSGLRYFIVRSGAGKWHLHPCPSLRAGIEALKRRGDRPWVVYTEGMGKIFTSDVDRGMRMAGQYGVNVLLLDYPSIHSGYGAYKNYRFAWNSSRRIFRDFAPLFDTLPRLRSAGIMTGSVNLFFHSMGNNLMRKLIQKEMLRSPYPGVWADNIILNSPCVPRRGSRRWIDSLSFAKAVIVNYNPDDRTLKLASIAGFRGILGLGPKQTISRRGTYVNFNAVAGNGHSNFLGLFGRTAPPPSAFEHYKLLFAGKALPLSDASRYAPDAKRKGVYMLR